MRPRAASPSRGPFEGPHGRATAAAQSLSGAVPESGAGPPGAGRRGSVALAVRNRGSGAPTRRPGPSRHERGTRSARFRPAGRRCPRRSRGVGPATRHGIARNVEAGSRASSTIRLRAWRTWWVHRPLSALRVSIGSYPPRRGLAIGERLGSVARVPRNVERHEHGGGVRMRRRPSLVLGAEPLVSRFCDAVADSAHAAASGPSAASRLRLRACSA